VGARDLLGLFGCLLSCYTGDAGKSAALRNDVFPGVWDQKASRDHQVLSSWASPSTRRGQRGIRYPSRVARHFLWRFAEPRSYFRSVRIIL
jgi:hypothetical protein